MLGLVYAAFIIIYSVFYWQFVAKLQTDFVDHVFWWLKNSAVWFIFAPCCWYYFSRQANQRHLLFCFSWLGLLLVTIAVLLQISFDYHYLKADFIGAFVLFLPRHAAIFVIICIYWWFFIMNKTVLPSELVGGAEPEPQQVIEQINDYIEVEYQGRPIRLKLNDISVIKSAGNYVEIESSEGCFLKRTSLKLLQSELPAQFCQCHRSTIVNLLHIIALKSQSTGSAIVTLQNQQTVNVSKRYKHRIKEQLALFPLAAKVSSN
ncbi:LytR/AlgR family response regulator transcription factor [Alishewanella sp. d11]|uniref:LytR/AlgR family response regulator transcription factor n=1 Tax=Alishewanella sp. d11 TaxID=3414030 RepID=UPI003BF91443